MTALWKGIWCEANQWTELSAAKLSVLVNLPKTGTLYIATTTGSPPTATPSPNAAPGSPEYDFGTFANLRSPSARLSRTAPPASSAGRRALVCGLRFSRNRKTNRGTP